MGEGCLGNAAAKTSDTREEGGGRRREKRAEGGSVARTEITEG